MNQKATLILEQRAFRKVEVNVPQIQVYYQIFKENAYVVVLLSIHEGNEFTKEQYEHMLGQIKESFQKRELSDIFLLTVASTRYPEIAKKVCGEQNICCLLYTSDAADDMHFG